MLQRAVDVEPDSTTWLVGLRRLNVRIGAPFESIVRIADGRQRTRIVRKAFSSAQRTAVTLCHGSGVFCAFVRDGRRECGSQEHKKPAFSRRRAFCILTPLRGAAEIPLTDRPRWLRSRADAGRFR